MQRNKAFSLIELLVLIAVIGVVAFFSLPAINDWIKDREVKKETNSLIAYLKDIKSEVDSGKFAMAWVHITPNPQTWVMSQGEWAQQMKVPAPARTAQNRLSSYNNKSILNHHKMCPGSAPGYNNEGTQKYTQYSTPYKWNGKVNWSPNTHVCISKNALIMPTSGEPIRGIPGRSWIMICSKSNTTTSGNKRCHYNMTTKTDYRYVIKVNPSLTFDLYKYNSNSDTWIKK